MGLEECECQDFEQPVIELEVKPSQGCINNLQIPASFNGKLATCSLCKKRSSMRCQRVQLASKGVLR